MTSHHMIFYKLKASKHRPQARSETILNFWARYVNSNNSASVAQARTKQLRKQSCCMYNTAWQHKLKYLYNLQTASVAQVRASQAQSHNNRMVSDIAMSTYTICCNPHITSHHITSHATPHHTTPFAYHSTA